MFRRLASWLLNDPIHSALTVVEGAPQAPVSVSDPFVEAALGRLNGEGRWRFGALTGDYNGIHQWDGYARRFGFAAASTHPQRAVALCLSHLPTPASGPQQLDLWIRGPAYYGSVGCPSSFLEGRL